VHQPDPGRLDELPGFLDLVRRDAGGIGRGRLVVPAQERQSLPAIQPGDEPRRRATERSAAIKQQQRPARRRNVPEPRALEHEAIHGSTQCTWPVGWSSASLWLGRIGGQSADACSNPPQLGQAELLQPPKGVLQRPHVDDPWTSPRWDSAGEFTQPMVLVGVW
jgi:hypothetical protein